MKTTQLTTTLKIERNPDALMYEEASEAVKENNGHCPCSLLHTPETKCPCKAFREQKSVGECHCGRYVKVQVKK